MDGKLLCWQYCMFRVSLFPKKLFSVVNMYDYSAVYTHNVLTVIFQVNLG